MAQGGGSLQEVSLGGRLFPVAADADASRNLGGFTNELQANGDGSVRPIKTRVPWSVTGIVLGMDPDRGDYEYIQDLSDSQALVEITMTEASQTTWQGTGTVTGDLTGSTMNGTMPVALGGSGKLSRQ